MKPVVKTHKYTQLSLALDMQKFIPVQIELYKNKIEHKRHKNQMLISEAYISSQYKWNETVNKE